MIYNKYRAKKTTVDEIEFDSYMESKRYRQLVTLEMAGEISDLVLQPKLRLMDS